MNVLALTEYTASMMNVSMGKANRWKINFNVRVILLQHNFWIMELIYVVQPLWKIPVAGFVLPLLNVSLPF